MIDATPNVEEVARALRSAAPTLDPAEQRLALKLYRLLLAGKPVTSRDLASSTGRDEGVVEEACSSPTAPPDAEEDDEVAHEAVSDLAAGQVVVQRGSGLRHGDHEAQVEQQLQGARGPMRLVRVAARHRDVPPVWPSCGSWLSVHYRCMDRTRGEAPAWADSKSARVRKP